MLCVRERLLLEPQLTLEKAITIATQIESATAEAKIMSMDTGGTVQAVTPLQKSSLPLQTHNCKRKTNEKPPNQQIQNTVKACFRCGSPQYLASYTEYPAKVAQYNHCKKIGHLLNYVAAASSVNRCMQLQYQMLLSIVTFGDGCVTAEFYIVHKGTPILGRDLLAALNLRVVNGRIEDIDSSEWVSPIIVMQKKEESAYHNVMLHEDSRDLTAFITHEGLFLFKHVPYGLASAPSAFQKMSLILKNQHGVQCYLDDIIMYGNTSEEHDNNLQSVLNCISTASLQLNRSKCKFRQTELCFLGHTISQAGLKPDPDHILAILNAPPPTDLQTLRSFLGLTSWYIKFTPNYASVIEPLQELLRRSSTLVWTTNAQASFETVKDLIVLSPVLALFSPALPTIVTTDASGYGLGRKYSTVKKEALACVWDHYF
ncbi:unnamed protein product, partial [Lepidochelys olivacea]